MSLLNHPRRVALAAGFAVALLGGAWLAAQQAVATATALPAVREAAQASRFNIDPVHSAATFQVIWQDMTPFYGQFNDFAGTVNYNGKEASSFSCDITLPVESIDTHNDGRDRHLKSPDFFNAPEFPNINFKSTRLADNGDGTWTVKGDLTMRGQTKPIEAKLSRLAVKQGQRGTRCGFATEFTINRSEWGVSYGAGQGLSDEVRLMIAIQSAAE